MSDVQQDQKPVRSKWWRWLRLLIRAVVAVLEKWAEPKDPWTPPPLPPAPPSPPTTPPTPTSQSLMGDEATDNEDAGVFSLSERVIYRYTAGMRKDPHTNELVPDERKVDPIWLWKRVMARGPEIDINRKVSKSRSQDALKCHDKLIACLREIFQVPHYDDGGLTEGELEALLDHFCTFIGLEKKVGNKSATSQAETGSVTPPSSESVVEPPVTAPGSDSGSTAEDNATVPSSPSPKV